MEGVIRKTNLGIPTIKNAAVEVDLDGDGTSFGAYSGRGYVLGASYSFSL